MRGKARETGAQKMNQCTLRKEHNKKFSGLLCAAVARRPKRKVFTNRNNNRNNSSFAVCCFCFFCACLLGQTKLTMAGEGGSISSNSSSHQWTKVLLVVLLVGYVGAWFLITQGTSAPRHLSHRHKTDDAEVLVSHTSLDAGAHHAPNNGNHARRRQEPQHSNSGINPTPLQSHNTTECETKRHQPVRIPKIIHQTWKDKQPLIAGSSTVATWRDLNPGYDYRFYTDDDLDSYIDEHHKEFKRAWARMKPIHRADLFRYLILHDVGGYYADIDVRLRVPLDDWPL